MVSSSHPLATTSARRPRGRIALAGLVGAAILVVPALASAESDSHYHHHVWGKTASEREESVELRISNMHKQLHITPAEEPAWAEVARVMQANETRMQDMITAREAEPVHHVTAPEDLKIYERFNQAHVEGLQQLRVSFEALYTAMPDAQKRVADEVFDKFGNGHD